MITAMDARSYGFMVFRTHSAIFQPQLAIAGVRHIRVDLPGFGASKPTSVGVGMADYSREIIAVLDHLHLDKVIAAGISMGGYIAMQMLRDAPRRIEGVILIDTRGSTPCCPR